ncbi:hypothetical protein MASR2M69_19360 [Bacteroidota bacterium]
MNAFIAKGRKKIIEAKFPIINNNSNVLKIALSFIINLLKLISLKEKNPRKTIKNESDKYKSDSGLRL